MFLSSGDSHHREPVEEKMLSFFMTPAQRSISHNELEFLLEELRRGKPYAYDAYICTLARVGSLKRTPKKLSCIPANTFW